MQSPHTGFRGFGAPQAVIIVESVLERLAAACALDVHHVRALNFYQPGDVSHVGLPIESFPILRMWREMGVVADVDARQAALEEFNKCNRWKKRGLSQIAVQLGMGFDAKFMNQAGALINIYLDGTVLISHGGLEMGQGLHTKIIQVAAHSLDIPTEFVHIAESTTSIVPNAMPTAGSVSTDLYGMAVLDACEQLKKRLAPIRTASAEDISWKDLVVAAHMERVDLSAHGFYIVPGDRCGYDFATQVGTPYQYHTQGVAVSEVEIDCLTGNFDLLRTDILMDIGKTLNPGIDIGQIEGAFIQGYGWSTMEELVRGDERNPWLQRGELHTNGPKGYKIPSFNDVPRDFRIHIVDMTSPPRGLHSSKAIGEPPLLLGSTVYFAIQV